MDRRARPGVVLALLMAAFFSTMVARLVVSPLVPEVIAAFSASKGSIGLALTAMWAAYALTQLPAGALADRHGERRLVLAGLSVTAVGSALLAFAPGLPSFAVAGVLVGVGSGLYFPAATALLTARFRNVGGALGLHISGGDLAGVVAPIVAVAVAARYGWRTALLFAPAVAVPVLALCAWRLPAVERSDVGRTLAERMDPRTLWDLLSRRRIAYTVGVATALMFVFQAIISFFPTFLIEYWSVDAGTAGAVFAATFLVWIALMPVAGRLSDAVGHDGVLAATTLAMTGGIALALAAPSFEAALVGVLLLGVGMSWGGVVASRFMANLPEADRTTGYGLVRSLYVFLGSAGSVVTGALAGAAGWGVAYGLLVALLAAVAASLLANAAFDLGL